MRSLRKDLACLHEGTKDGKEKGRKNLVIESIALRRMNRMTHLKKGRKKERWTERSKLAVKCKMYIAIITTYKNKLTELRSNTA